jgi:hypothetical protein
MPRVLSAPTLPNFTARPNTGSGNCKKTRVIGPAASGDDGPLLGAGGRSGLAFG